VVTNTLLRETGTHNGKSTRADVVLWKDKHYKVKRVTDKMQFGFCRAICGVEEAD
jgi:hypothetical protein